MLRLYFNPIGKSLLITARLGNTHPLVFVNTDTNRLCFAAYSNIFHQWIDAAGWLQSWEYFKMSARTRYGVEFVNIKVAPDQKSDFLKWAKTAQDDLGTFLINLVGAGYKLSANCDEQNDCFIVAVTGTQASRENRGLCVTSRSDDLIEAILLAMYKHFVICDSGSWGAPEERNDSWG
jgi:hypothetical protein